MLSLAAGGFVVVVLVSCLQRAWCGFPPEPGASRLLSSDPWSHRCQHGVEVFLLRHLFLLFSLPSVHLKELMFMGSPAPVFFFFFFPSDCFGGSCCAVNLPGCFKPHLGAHSLK